MSKRYFKDNRGWPMDARKTIEMFFPGKGYGTTVPPEVSAFRINYDGVNVQYLTSDAAKAFWKKGPRCTTPMRAIAQCPHCLKITAFSRLNQHMVVHKDAA